MNWCRVGVGLEDLQRLAQQIQVVKTTIRPATTRPMVPATTRPKMPAAIAPREALAGRPARVERDEGERPWLVAEISSNVLSAGRAKANKLPMLLSTSGQMSH